MLLVTQLERVFRFKDKEQDIELADPSAGMSAESVLNFYSPMYPILTTAKIEGPEIINDKIQYRFATTIGTKG